jgi:hypothetical protein
VFISGFLTDKPLHPNSACGDERLDSVELAFCFGCGAAPITYVPIPALFVGPWILTPHSQILYKEAGAGAALFNPFSPLVDIF